MAQLSGILPALVTPLVSTAESAPVLDVAAFERLLEWVYAAGVDGVYLCGSTGEGLLLPAALRKQIVEIAVRNTPGGVGAKHVIVHCGAWNPLEARELARHAERQGASAISCLPPAGANDREMVASYRALAGCTGLPFLGYYFPADRGASLSLAQLEELCELPGAVGLKFTDYDLFTLSLLSRKGKLIFHGRDEMLAAGFLMGACGGIGSIYNVVPGWFVALRQHALAGRWDEARRLQDRINDLIRVLVARPFLPALKRTLAWQGLACGAALEPRMPLSASEEAGLIAALESIDGLPRHAL